MPKDTAELIAEICRSNAIDVRQLEQLQHLRQQLDQLVRAGLFVASESVAARSNAKPDVAKPKPFANAAALFGVRR